MLIDYPRRPGVIKDSSEYGAMGYAVDSDKIRFVRGTPQTMGGQEIATTDRFEGRCRGLWTWARLDSKIFVAMGTHSGLFAYSDGKIYNITPLRSTGTYANNPFATTDSSDIVTVTQTNHGGQTGERVMIYDSAAVGGITPGGPSNVALPADPFTVALNRRDVLVNAPNHGMRSGDQVRIAGAVNVAGINFNGTWLIYVNDVDSYTFETQTLATANASGGGGAVTASYGRSYPIARVDENSYTIQHIAAATSTATGGGNAAKYDFEMTAGNIDGLGGYGYGVGGYGTGPYSLSAQGFEYLGPRYWALSNYGEDLVAMAGNGRTYYWPMCTGIRAAPLANAPDQNFWTIVTPERLIMTFGTKDLSGTFDPLLIRWSGDATGDATVWTPSLLNLAGDYRIGEGGQLVAARSTNGGILVWTNYALYFGRFVENDPEAVYQFTLVGTGCGLIGPNAVVNHDGAAYWMAPGYHIYRFRGGVPEPVTCPNRQWLENLAAPAQEYKIYAAFDAAYTAVTWYFPTIEGDNENNRYLRWDLREAENDPVAGWSVGTFDRTAWIDRNIAERPYATDRNGQLYIQEQGRSDNGGPIVRYIQYAPLEVAGPGKGDALTYLRRIVWAAQQDSAFQVTLEGRQWPNSPPYERGPFVVGPGTPRTDVRMQGRQIAMRIESNSTDDFWRLDNCRLDLTEGRQR